MKVHLIYFIAITALFTLMLCCDAGPKSTTSNPTLNRPRTSLSADLNLPNRLIKIQEDRSIWQRPDIVLTTLGDISDKVVADLGAGTGYFTWRLIPHTKKVIALDIDDEAIAYLDSMSTYLPAEYAAHLEVRKTGPSHAELTNGEADIILIVNTYTYLPDRIQYLSDLKSLLPENGQLLIIDFKKKNIPIGPESKDKIALYQVEQELEQAGFTTYHSDDQSLNYQYIVNAIK